MLAPGSRQRSGANTGQASSAVNDRIGAISLSSASVMCQSAVCALRRARLFSAVV